MKRNLGREIAEIFTEKIKHCKESLTLRIAGRENIFTRDRKLTAKHIVSMILQPAKQSLRARLWEFGINYMDGTFATKQAFSKQRQFVNPEYIREYYDEAVEELITNGELETFKGMHLTAVDGTRIECENTPELIEAFGCSGPKKNACTALASTVYDVIERVSYDCQIGSYSLSERALLDLHLNKLASFEKEKFLIIGDRGYPSYDLMETLVDRGFSYVLRLSGCWSYYIPRMGIEYDKSFDYDYKGKAYPFRVLKIELADKIEYLATNLDNVTLSLEEAKYIYSLRWNIETFYSFIKTEHELENFSGKTKNAVLQEFYATMAIANMCQCFINDADKTIAAEQVNTDRIYSHQANRRLCIGHIANKFLECIFTDSSRKRVRLWKEVMQYCESFSEPIRPDRSPARKNPRDKKFYANARKPSLS